MNVMQLEGVKDLQDEGLSDVDMQTIQSLILEAARMAQNLARDTGRLIREGVIDETGLPMTGRMISRSLVALHTSLNRAQGILVQVSTANGDIAKHRARARKSNARRKPIKK